MREARLSAREGGKGVNGEGAKEGKGEELTRKIRDL